jgi:phosphoribosylaminoimidazolecarboxamide formyltransferase/IMP cyclohydrolase
MAPDFDADALSILQKKEQRILLKIRSLKVSPRTFRSLLHGVVEQEVDKATETETDLRLVTRRAPTPAEVGELLFAVKCVKHLKSNAIALIQNKQLVGMGCGQPSRVDALRQAIAKAHAFGFDLTGSVMASDAFFPFPDCVEIAHEHGITAVVQPGGSVKDQDCIDACDDRGMAMVFTGFRHFKH